MGVASGVSVGDAVGDVLGDSVGVETGAGGGHVTAALSTGLRLLLLLMATESACHVYEDLSYCTFFYFLFEFDDYIHFIGGFFTTAVVPSVNAAAASFICRRIFE